MNTKKLEQQILDLLDGTIDATDLRSLQSELKSNPEAQDLYRDFVHLKNALELRAAAQTAIHPPLVPIDELLEKQRSKTIRYSLFATAAILLLSFATLLYFKLPAPQPLLSYKTAPDTVFSVTHAQDSEHRNLSMLQGSRLQLSKGSVELTFTSGIRSIITAPADLTLLSADHLKLNQGTSWFHVPSNAVGFTVTTKNLIIKDLGTEFGIIGGNDERHEVHVFDGAVEVTTLESPSETLLLSKGEAIKQGAYGFLEKTGAQLSGFLKELPETQLHPHWSFDQFKVEPSHYPANRNIQTNLHQLTKNSYHEPFSKGKFGSCLALDGKNTYVSATHPGILGDAPRSIAFWLKTPPLRTEKTIPNPIQSRTLIGWGQDYQRTFKNSHLNHKFTIHLDYVLDHHPMLNISYGGFWYFSPDSVLDDEEWHHVVVTFDGQYDAEGHPNTLLYIDGQLRKLEPAVENKQPRTAENNLIVDTRGDAKVFIGSNLPIPSLGISESDALLTGFLDEIYIVDRAITQKEVNTLMRSNQLAQ